jgi:dihydroorotase
MTNNLLIKSAKVIDAKSKWNNQLVDVFIENGKISNIAPEINQANIETFDASGNCISLGWFDAFATCPDPGANWKEDLISLSHAARIGGFTSVAALCGTNPLPENATVISQIKHASNQCDVQIYPLGLSSEQQLGEEMAEVFEMFQAGSIGQTDGIVSSASVSLRSKLMQYCASLNIPYLHFPFESKLVTGGVVNEGIVNVNLGLKGLPVVSETMAILSDLVMAEWLEVPLRIIGISSAASVEIIRKAKSDGIKVYAAVPIMNLAYNENAVGEFDENFKVYPPLRTESDRLALVQGVLDGTIDAIMSNHCPDDIESKNVEFEYATFGAATLPSFYNMMLETFGSDFNKVVNTLVNGANKIYNMPERSFEIGEIADFTLFSSESTHFLTRQNQGTKAYNVLGLNKISKGKVMAVVSKGILYNN